jgi:hypothetical protein
VDEAGRAAEYNANGNKTDHSYIEHRMMDYEVFAVCKNAMRKSEVTNHYDAERYCSYGDEHV